LNELLILFDDIFHNGIVPSSFKRAIIFPLYKKGDFDAVQNYRGLSFIDSINNLAGDMEQSQPLVTAVKITLVKKPLRLPFNTLREWGFNSS
jgi:hypothetical protein